MAMLLFCIIAGTGAADAPNCDGRKRCYSMVAPHSCAVSKCAGVHIELCTHAGAAAAGAAGCDERQHRHSGVPAAARRGRAGGKPSAQPCRRCCKTPANSSSLETGQHRRVITRAVLQVLLQSIVYAILPGFCCNCPTCAPLCWHTKSMIPAIILQAASGAPPMAAARPASQAQQAARIPCRCRSTEAVACMAAAASSAHIGQRCRQPIAEQGASDRYIMQCWRKSYCQVLGVTSSTFYGKQLEEEVHFGLMVRGATHLFLMHAV